jgi:hypothetical protein
MSKTKRKWLVTSGLGLGILAFASLAAAGMKWTYPLKVDTKTRFVEAALSTVRNSSNVNEWVSCNLVGDASGGYISCAGFDGTNYIGCYHPKSKPNFTPLVLAVQSLDGDSLLQFQAAADGSCASITVNDGSYWAPKAP